MIEQERKAWNALAEALESINGFVGGPRQMQALDFAIAIISDLLDDDATQHIVELETEVQYLSEHAKRLMRASRQLLNDSGQQPRDYARQVIARYLADYPEAEQ